MNNDNLQLFQLASYLAERLKQTLPGVSAHALMRAKFTGKVRPKFEHTDPPRPGSVLILLYEEEGVVKFPLIKRPDYVGTHGGQISLPGGKAELGEDQVQTALREGQEEVGVVPESINVLGRLSDFHVFPSNFMITPIVAMTETPPAFVPDPVEVERILFANIDDLLREDAVKEKELLAGGQFQMMAPHFEIGGEVVWGATAMMLNEFRMVLMEM